MACRGVLDGSKCWFSVSSTANLTVVLCPLCSEEDKCPQPLYITSGKPAKVCLRIGHAPDLSTSLRGSIEEALRTLSVGSTCETTLVVNDDYHVKVTLRLDALASPLSFSPTPVADDEEREQLRPKALQEEEGGDTETDTEDPSIQVAWRASISNWYLARVLSLKTRGTHLFKTAHVGRVDASAIGRLNAAFSCYSRALQLITLLGLVFQLNENEAVVDEIETIEGTLTADPEEYIDLDACAPLLHCNEPEIKAAMMERVHFTLLSNMALCQLKAKSFAFAVKQCDMALQFVPDDDVLLKQTGRLTVTDVEKVLFRRASAFASMGQLDEGIADTQRLLQLNPDNRAAQKLFSDLKSRVTNFQTKMAERLKNAF